MSTNRRYARGDVSRILERLSGEMNTSDGIVVRVAFVFIIHYPLSLSFPFLFCA